MKNKVRITLLKIPIFKEFVRVVSRLRIANNYYKDVRRNIWSWSFSKTEDFNHYYDLTELNTSYLISLIATLLDKSNQEITLYVNELQNDTYLRNLISLNFRSDKSMRDSTFGYGRRLGWYVFVRALKPKLIIETGVHQGIGAVILGRALEINSTEGFFGKYIGTEIDKSYGTLFNSNFSHIGKIHYGDSIETLNNLHENIDLFINDSDHSISYEYEEYVAIKDKLSSEGIIIGDNCHASNSLLRFSIENSRNFVFFRESPANHWYPGGGIGISMKKKV